MRPVRTKTMQISFGVWGLRSSKIYSSLYLSTTFSTISNNNKELWPDVRNVSHLNFSVHGLTKTSKQYFPRVWPHSLACLLGVQLCAPLNTEQKGGEERRRGEKRRGEKGREGTRLVPVKWVVLTVCKPAVRRGTPVNWPGTLSRDTIQALNTTRNHYLAKSHSIVNEVLPRPEQTISDIPSSLSEMRASRKKKKCCGTLTSPASLRMPTKGNNIFESCSLNTSNNNGFQCNFINWRLHCLLIVWWS